MKSIRERIFNQILEKKVTSKIKYIKKNKKNYKQIKKAFKNNIFKIKRQKLNKLLKKIIFIYYKKCFIGAGSIPPKFLRKTSFNEINYLKNKIFYKIKDENIEIQKITNNGAYSCGYNLNIKIKFNNKLYFIIIWLSSLYRCSYVSCILFENNNIISLNNNEIPYIVKKTNDFVINLLFSINMIVLPKEIVEIRIPGAQMELYSLNDSIASVFDLVFSEVQTSMNLYDNNIF